MMASEDSYWLFRRNLTLRELKEKMSSKRKRRRYCPVLNPPTMEFQASRT
jgi:hypothetical protein